MAEYKLKSNIVKLENDSNQMKSNLSALSGAIQVIDRLISKSITERDEGFRGMPKNEVDDLVKAEKKKTKGKK